MRNNTALSNVFQWSTAILREQHQYFTKATLAMTRLIGLPDEHRLFRYSVQSQLLEHLGVW